MLFSLEKALDSRNYKKGQTNTQNSQKLLPITYIYYHQAQYNIISAKKQLSKLLTLSNLHEQKTRQKKKKK